MIIMPASGIAMGYYGGELLVHNVKNVDLDSTSCWLTKPLVSCYTPGKGLPFFGTTFAGITKTEENKKSTGAIAGQVGDDVDALEA